MDKAQNHLDALRNDLQGRQADVLRDLNLAARTGKAREADRLANVLAMMHGAVRSLALGVEA